MILRWTWPPWQDRILSLTFHATPATPSPWTALPSPPSLWISWIRVLTTAPAVHRTPCARDSQTTCVTEGSVSASILTTRTRLYLFPCRFTLRAPPLWATAVPRTRFLPRRAPTALTSDLCFTVQAHTHTHLQRLAHAHITVHAHIIWREVTHKLSLLIEPHGGWQIWAWSAAGKYYIKLATLLFKKTHILILVWLLLKQKL